MSVVHPSMWTREGYAACITALKCHSYQSWSMLRLRCGGLLCWQSQVCQSACSVAYAWHADLQGDTQHWEDRHNT